VLTSSEVMTNDKLCNHDVAYCSVLGIFNAPMCLDVESTTEGVL